MIEGLLMIRYGVWILLLLLLGSPATVRGSEKLAGIACRSVHLQYPADEATAFYNEVTVERSADGTYFAVCGWHKGYFGIQQLRDGRTVAIFSVWDPPRGDNPDGVPPQERVKLLHHDPSVRIGRFGNEGTGGQSFYDLAWEPGETHRFLVTAKPAGERTQYTGHLYLPAEKRWLHMVTFSTMSGGAGIRGCYSFVEDFARNRVSTTHERRAKFGNGWVRGMNGDWRPLTQARFTADGNPAVTIDAGVAGSTFFLATGGAVENRHARLREMMQLLEPADAQPPADVRALVE